LKQQQEQVQKRQQQSQENPGKQENPGDPGKSDEGIQIDTFDGFLAERLSYIMS
jgi:hypothetical protein